MKNFTIMLVLICTTLISHGQQLDKLISKTSNRDFIENKGQIRDENDKSNSSVKYIFNEGVFNLELKKNGFSYELFTVIPDQQPDEAGFMQNNDVDDDNRSETRIASSHRVDVEFVGANSKCVILPSEKTDHHYNFYFAPVTQNHVENVNSFRAVTYQNIYPGIDVVFTSTGKPEAGSLEYRFLVHPGADASMIRLKYHGAQGLSFDENGMLDINCVNGFVKEAAPYSFLTGTNEKVESHVMIEKNTASFSVANYDRTQTLIIDPSIIWGTYYGGESTEDIAEIAVDSQHKPTIAGNTLSTTNIATAGAYQTTFAGGFHDFFIAKFNATGQIEWATYLGGSGRDLGFGVAVDNVDNIYFNGKTTSDGIASAGAYQTLRGGMDDAIIAKFNTNGGALLWCTYFGGTGNDQFRAFTFDSDNDMYICGYTESANAISTVGAQQEVYGGAGDGVITKWTPEGSVIWSTYFGGYGEERYHSITTDLFGHLYIIGTTSLTDGVTTAGAYQTIYGGGDADILLTKMDLDGNLIWSTYYGGELHDRGRGVETDSAGNVYCAGFTNSSTGISTPGAVQTAWSEGYDTQTNEPLDDDMLFSISSDGTTRVWGTYYGGGAKEECWGMNIDRKQKCLYIVGSSQSDHLIAYGNAWQPVKSTGSDAIWARWKYDGGITYGTYFGNKDGEQFEDVEVDQDSYIYLVGKTESDKLPVTYGVYQVDTNGGAYDGVVYKFYGGIACRDMNEPNETFSTAKPIYARTNIDSLVYGYDGNLINSTDKDYFKITVAAPYKNYFIELTGLSHNYNIKFYNSAQVLKAQSTKIGLTADTLILNNLPNGDYYLQVLAGTPNEYDTMKCYHLNILKSSTKIKHHYNQSRLGDEDDLSDLKIYPNPFADQLGLEITADKNDNAQVQIFDMAGHLVKQQSISLIEGLQQIDLTVPGLSAGIYNLVISSSAKRWVRMIVKE